MLLTAKQPIASTIPTEGATGWADTTMMHAEAQHQNCAYKWMEHSLSNKVQGDLASWFGLVRCLLCQPLVKTMLYSVLMAVKLTGFITLIKFIFGKRPQQNAPHKKALASLTPLGVQIL